MKTCFCSKNKVSHALNAVRNHVTLCHVNTLNVSSPGGGHRAGLSAGAEPLLSVQISGFSSVSLPTRLVCSADQ